MTHRSWTRRLSAALLLVSILSLVPLTTADAVPNLRHHRPVVSRHQVCPIPWRLGPARVRRLIRCAAAHFGVDADKAVAVAERESHFHPHAFNSWSCAKGVFQHLCQYWAGRARAYGYRGWSAFNARANVMVTMRMVRRFGWTPWGG